MEIISPKENIIYEDEETIVALSLDPISKGHVIIKPKEKFKDIDELPQNLLNKILKLTQCYVSLLKRQYSSKGYSIMQNGGEFNDTGQFHLHIFPRNNKKEFSWTYSHEIDKYVVNLTEIKIELEKEFQHLLNQ